jgi:hypothetical protein
MLLQLRIVNGKIQIPVVVNVLYRTTSENINSTNSITIDILNEDFNALNADFNSVPAAFSGVKANVGISFVLEASIVK